MIDFIKDVFGSLLHSDAANTSDEIKNAPAFLVLSLAVAHMGMGAALGHFLATGYWRIFSVCLLLFCGFQIIQIGNSGGAFWTVFVDTIYDFLWLLIGILLQLYSRSLPAHQLMLGLLEWADYRRARRNE